MEISRGRNWGDLFATKVQVFIHLATGLGDNIRVHLITTAGLNQLKGIWRSLVLECKRMWTQMFRKKQLRYIYAPVRM